MVLLARVESDVLAAERLVDGALRSGRALETFRSMIQAHGGNPRVVDSYDLLPQAPDRTVFPAPSTGFVATLGAEALGRASNALGAGRLKIGDPIDHGVGLVTQVRVGARVTAGQPLIELHHRGGRGVEAAMELCRAAVTISDVSPPARDKVLGEVR
jgi:pyrimidine-nucleoside phosphorylase